jgi:hypothetical protein
MNNGETSTIERAIALAQSGSCSSMDDIRRSLKREGADGIDQHLASGALRKQLQSLMVVAKAKRAGA